MVSGSDFTLTCNTTIIDSAQCTPDTCCLAQGQIAYLPTLAGNALFAAIFAILIIPHILFGIRYKTWSFMSWMAFGLVGEVVGYIGRVMLHNNIFDFNAFLMYLIPLTIAPAFITASIYLCLARVIYILDPSLVHTRLTPMTYTKIFVTFDFISLVLQGAGGGVAATADNDKAMNDMGVNIMIAGLAFQVISLVIFSCLCCDFAWRLYKGIVSSGVSFKVSDTDTSDAELGGLSSTDYASIKASKMFKGFIVALVAATILIITRSSYRLAELQEGFNGKLANDEVLFMILEGPMIILTCIGLTVFHPGLAMRGLWSMKGFQKSGGADVGDKLMMTSATNSAVHSRSGSDEDVSGEQRAPYVNAQGYSVLAVPAKRR